jgi:O-antigen ligase
VIDTGGINDYFSEFLNKVMFNESGNVTSSGQRVYQWTRAVENFSIHPIFGHGPGYGVHEEQEGYLSVYLSILADIGIFAFLAFFMAIGLLFKKAQQISSKVRPFLLFAFLTSSTHLLIVSDFYHAPFWILLMLIQLVYTEEKKQ